MNDIAKIGANSETYQFKGFGIHNSECGLTTFERDGKVLMIFTDLGKGTSVTNAIEQLATEVYAARYNHLSPDSVFVVEHYGAISDEPLKERFMDAYKDGQWPTRDEEFDLVQLQWDGRAFHAPDWRRLNPDSVTKLLS